MKPVLKWKWIRLDVTEAAIMDCEPGGCGRVGIKVSNLMTWIYPPTRMLIPRHHQMFTRFFVGSPYKSLKMPLLVGGGVDPTYDWRFWSISSFIAWKIAAAFWRCIGAKSSPKSTSSIWIQNTGSFIFSLHTCDDLSGSLDLFCQKKQQKMPPFSPNRKKKHVSFFSVYPPSTNINGRPPIVAMFPPQSLKKCRKNADHPS